MEILLKEINSNNWKECIDLSVKGDQRDFVDPNSHSLLQTKFEKYLYPLSIYEKNTMVGFLMYGRESSTERIVLHRLMIDEKYQGKGYGKEALKKLINLIKNKYGNIKLYTSVEPENLSALLLYESIGFVKTEEIIEGENVLEIKL